MRMIAVMIVGMFPVSWSVLQWPECSVAAPCWHGVWYTQCSAVSAVWSTGCRGLQAAEPTAVFSRSPRRPFCTQPHSWLFLHLHSRYII